MAACKKGEADLVKRFLRHIEVHLVEFMKTISAYKQEILNTLCGEIKENLAVVLHYWWPVGV